MAVIGLGYVGLPLAVELAKLQTCRRTGSELKRRVIGFDTNSERLAELRQGFDRTKEINPHELHAAQRLEFTGNWQLLAEVDVYVVTVPTPIDIAKRPNLSALAKASTSVGMALKARAANGTVTTPLVIYESTVYPGITEEFCVPILVRESGLCFNSAVPGCGFFCGYSPERINPGDTEHRLTTITKVTSGSTSDAAAWIDCFYGSIIDAGTYPAASIKVAEAAKVIENTQRDLNIALVNELAIIFHRMQIDTLDVLEAAGSKWNFLPFRPGLVGGHCIGVDPYYLTYKAEEVGYSPQVVVAGRRINDWMGGGLAEQVVLALAKRRQPVVGKKVLMLGLSFKENCPDLRNTKVVDMIRGLERYGMDLEVVDPCVDPEEAQREYDLKVLSDIPTNANYSAVVAAVSHQEFVSLSLEQWKQLVLPGGLLFDLKGIMPRQLDPLRL